MITPLSRLAHRGRLPRASAIPALLVLYFLKLRRREMPVSSTILWRKAIQDLQVNAPFQKLRRNLLLLLQLLLLLLLLLALSRPVSNYTPGTGQDHRHPHRPLGLDGRRDVDGHSRLEEAKRLARDLVAGMKRDGDAMVIAFDEAAEMLQPFTSDQNLLRNAIDSIQQTDRPTDLRLAYQLAEAQINFNPEQLRPSTDPPDVRLYSDGRVLNEDDLRHHGHHVTYEKLGDDNRANVGIVALSAKRNYERPTEVQVFARLANFGPEPVTRRRAAQRGRRARRYRRSRKPRKRSCSPSAGPRTDKTKYEEQHGRSRSEGVQFTLKLTQARGHQGRADHKEGDVLAADDVAAIVVPPPKTLSVLLVTDSNYLLTAPSKA